LFLFWEICGDAIVHYYKRNLGDYAKKAGRLSMLQHGSYTLLIDACYDREVFPTLEQAIEWTWASTEQEIEAVKFVLSRFFKLSEDGTYVQDRILSELLEYHAKADKNKRIAIERETKRKQGNTKRAPDVNEPPPNHKPITNNQEPVVDAAPKGTAKAKRLSPDWQLPKAWGEWTLENMAWGESSVRLEAEKFKDYWIAKGGREACKLDWEATWRNWCRSAKVQTGQAGGSLLVGGI
jgi:uncharacterized protein YdaU (DUF1376 family)